MSQIFHYYLCGSSNICGYILRDFTIYLSDFFKNSYLFGGHKIVFVSKKLPFRLKTVSLIRM